MDLAIPWPINNIQNKRKFVEWIFNKHMSKDKNLAVPQGVMINKIYLVRNHKVMLDDDLAELYQNRNQKA